jgi:hypothetical protein
MKKIFLFIVTINLSFNGFSQCGGIGDQLGKLGNSLDSAYQLLKKWVIEGYAVLDPNDIEGQQGYGTKQWVSVKDRMNYTINFENNGDFANSAVQNAYIHFPVPAKVDINSLRLSSFGFGAYDFQVPDNTSSYTTRLNMTDSLGIYVDVTAGIDVTNNEIFWFFKSIDPLTGGPPNDARGFLGLSDTGAAKLTDTSSKGQGYVQFYIAPLASDVTGDTVAAQASIIFDVNEALSTNIWSNTVDAFPPTSKILTSTVSANTITLTWSGQDDAGGSGVRDYALYASENGRPFQLYKDGITGLSTTYKGTPGNTYCFFTLATDNTGNQEALKNVCEVSVDLGIDHTLPVTWLYFTGQPQGEDALLNWATVTEQNTHTFVVERSLDGSNFMDIGSVQASGTSSQVNDYQYLDKNAMELPAKTLYYRLRQVDIDGKFTYSTIVTVAVQQTSTAPSVRAYPNPFNQDITLQILNVTATGQSQSVGLYSVEGKLLYQQRIVYTGNTTVLLNNLPALTPGVYMLQVVIDKRSFIIKMIKGNKN